MNIFSNNLLLVTTHQLWSFKMVYAHKIRKCHSMISRFSSVGFFFLKENLFCPLYLPAWTLHQAIFQNIARFSQHFSILQCLFLSIMHFVKPFFTMKVSPSSCQISVQYETLFKNILSTSISTLGEWIRDRTCEVGYFFVQLLGVQVP